jgi:16S rRNA (guanine(1405)-N(7))-methyltransferase
VPGEAQACDVLGELPTRHYDLALLLKTLPCLEQIEKDVGARLLEAIDAAYLLVSFPVRSLGGRDKGMAENYPARFMETVKGYGWGIKRFGFETELAFLVKKSGS